MTFFKDGVELWVISPNGRAMFWTDGNWGPKSGSLKMAAEVLGDERALEVPPEDVPSILERFGATKPDFG